MEKSRDLLKKIRDTKGTFHAKMGTIEDRNVTDLTEEEDIIYKLSNRVTIYSLAVLLSLFGTSLLFHVQF